MLSFYANIATGQRHTNTLSVLALSTLLLMALYALVLALIKRRRRLITGCECLNNTADKRRVHVFTFANHKGGTGKTSLLFFSLKELIAREEALRDKTKFLVIDASVYGDLTRLMIKDPDEVKALVDEGKTIESLAETLFKPHDWWASSPPIGSLLDFLYHVEGVPGNHPSVFLLSTRHQLLCQSEAISSHDVPELTDLQVNVLSNCLKSFLETEGSEWIVMVDTDGGITHSFTKLAIGLADSLVVPITASMGSVSDNQRLKILFDSVADLRSRHMSNALVELAVFNLIESSKNSNKSDLGCPFTPPRDVVTTMRTIIDLFRSPESLWQSRYSDILISFTKPTSECFTAVRNGGVEFRKAAADPWNHGAGDAQIDITVLTDKLIAILRKYRSNADTTAIMKKYVSEQ